MGRPMSALGQKRTFALQNDMSALSPRADMCGPTWDVCYGPIADIKVGEYSLCGAFDPRADFAAKHPKIDRFCKKRFRAALQCLALGVRIAIGSDHNDRNIRSSCLGFGQQLKPCHSRHVDVG